MIKRFFISMLGSMAAIWLSAGLLVLLFIFMIVGAVASTSKGNSAPVEVKRGSVLVLTLDRTIDERPVAPKFADIINGSDNMSAGLNEIVGAIWRAAADDRIKGLVLDCEGSLAGMATRQAIAEAIVGFKASGKWVVSYADSYTQGDYYIASAADSLWVNPQGMVDVHGLGATVMFYTGLLEKLGVEMQVLRVGTFKSAVEPYMLKEMSPASRQQMEEYVDAMWSVLRKGIASNRNVAEAVVDEWADSLLMTVGQQALVERGVVDALKYRHEAESAIAALCGEEDIDDVNSVSVTEYCSAINVLDPSWIEGVKRSSSHEIAVLYAVGEIVDRGSGGIVGEDMVDEILDLADDDDVAGLVLRVNSPGGSAFASEQIWEAIEQFKSRTGKPVFVSMGDYAASGGYYISCGADRIYAQPTTLTGSIGIFGMVPCIKGFLNDKLGITTSVVASGANGAFPSVSEPMTPAQRAKMQAYVARGYETFVGRCAAGRNLSVDSVKSIAEGRVWAGTAARQLGLVDELGSLTDAVNGMVEYLELDSYDVVEYPRVDLKWWEELMTLELAVQERSARSLLGDEMFELYRSVDRIRDMEQIQCRMEPVVVD